jgi:flagellar biosynthesis protein FliP
MRKQILIPIALVLFLAMFAVAREIMRSAVTPFSDCEIECLKKFPNDTEKRLNCMLKCTADGKVAVLRVLALR